MIRLTVVIELKGQASRALTHESNAKTFILGRDPSADFSIPLSTISRHHARISEADGVYVIEDLRSTHGTIVNGRKVAEGEKKVLRDGDIIELSQAKITCNIEAQKLSSIDPGEGTQAIAAKAVQGILGRLGEAQSEGPFFRVLSGPDEGARLPLAGTNTEWSLGRSTDCEFVINDANISRRHAVIKKDWNGFTIEDLGSRNGVVINDQRIQKPKRLKDRDEVVIGPIRLVFVDPDAELLAALKDVPGFALNDAELGLEQSSVGVPQSAPARVVEPIQPPSPAPAEPVSPFRLHPPQEEDVAAGIDPDLLEHSPRRFPTEWAIIGTVGLVVVSALVLLFVILV